MHTDRETSDEDGRPAPLEEPAPPAQEVSPSAAPASPASSPAPSPAPAHEYGYGDESAVPADPYAATGPGPDGAAGHDGAAGPDGAAPSDTSEPADLSATEARSVTGVQGVTAPRAMLRPVPEGFPTPPPRPARPNRRPAKAQEPENGRSSRRGLIVTAIVVVSVLVLAVAVGGGILAVRALSSGGSDPAATPAGSDAPQDPSSGGVVEIGEVTVTAVGTEVGVRSIGTRARPAEPEGEFVIVTIEIANAGDRPVTLTEDRALLESADGATHAFDFEASNLHTADSEPPGITTGGSTTRFHLVYDVPIGTEVSALQLDFDSAGSGSLPLGG